MRNVRGEVNVAGENSLNIMQDGRVRLEENAHVTVGGAGGGLFRNFVNNTIIT